MVRILNTYTFLDMGNTFVSQHGLHSCYLWREAVPTIGIHPMPLQSHTNHHEHI